MPEHRPLYLVIIVCLCALALGLIVDFSLAPADFPTGSIVHIPENSGLSGIADSLYADHAIRSPMLFRFAVVAAGSASGGGHSARAGDYFLQRPENVWQLAYRLDHNEQDLEPVRVTFPEGIDVREMGDILSADIASSSASVSPAFIFNEKGFLVLASTSEGYLFPDTYFFLPNVMPAEVVAVMKDNFNKKIAGISSDIVAFQASTTAKSYPRTLGNIVIMASILEREATSTADRRIIAGILWKRLDAGEPLQVDAPFLYILNKTSAELTIKDLATSSPYNTYVHKGLTPTPIGNPGLDALTAAVTPVATNYWYYVSDKSGAIHYSATYAGQETNQAKYVR